MGKFYSQPPSKNPLNYFIIYDNWNGTLKKWATIAYLHFLTKWRQVTRTTEFCLVVTNIFGSLVRKFLQFNIPVPRILSFLLNF